MWLALNMGVIQVSAAPLTVQLHADGLGKAVEGDLSVLVLDIHIGELSKAITSQHWPLWSLGKSIDRQDQSLCLCLLTVTLSFK